MNRPENNYVINFNIDIGNVTIDNNDKYLLKLDNQLFKGSNQVYADLILYIIQKKFKNNERKRQLKLTVLTKTSNIRHSGLNLSNLMINANQDYSRLVELIIKELKVYESLFEKFYGNEFLNFPSEARNVKNAVESLLKRNSGYPLSRYAYNSKNKFFSYCYLAIAFRLNELCFPHNFNESVVLTSDFILDSYEQRILTLKRHSSKVTKEQLAKPIKTILKNMNPPSKNISSEVIAIINYIFATKKIKLTKNQFTNRDVLMNYEPCNLVLYLESVLHIDLSSYRRKLYSYLIHNHRLKKSTIYKKTKKTQQQVLNEFKTFLINYQESSHNVQLIRPCNFIIQFQDSIREDISEYFSKLKSEKEKFELKNKQLVNMDTLIKLYLSSLNEIYSYYSFLTHDKIIEKSMQRVSREKNIDSATIETLKEIGISFLRRKDIIENELLNFLLNEIPKEVAMFEPTENIIRRFENKYQESFILHKSFITNDNEDINKKIIDFRRLIRNFEKLGSIDLKKFQNVSLRTTLSKEKQIMFLTPLIDMYENMFDLSKLNKTPLCLFNYKLMPSGGAAAENGENCNYLKVQSKISEYMKKFSQLPEYADIYQAVKIDTINVKDVYFRRLYSLYKKSKSVSQFLNQINKEYIWRMKNYTQIKELMENEIVDYMYAYKDKFDLLKGGAAAEEVEELPQTELTKEKIHNMLREELENGTFRNL